MNIPLKNFEVGKSQVFQEEISPDDLDVDIGVMRFPDNLVLKAEAWKDKNELVVQAHVEGDCEYTCSLCLEEFNNLFEKDITLHYDIKGLDTINIDPDVRDEIILEHPIRIVCKPDCKGLCPFCGVNLNEEKCDCKTDE